MFFFFRIGHDNKGGFAGWFLDKVIINVPSLGQNVVFPCGRWLDKGKDDGKLERELSVAEDSAQVFRPRKCTPLSIIDILAIRGVCVRVTRDGSHRVLTVLVP